MRTELHDQLTDWAVTRGEKPNAVSPAWNVVSQHSLLSIILPFKPSAFRSLRTLIIPMANEYEPSSSSVSSQSITDSTYTTPATGPPEMKPQKVPTLFTPSPTPTYSSSQNQSDIDPDISNSANPSIPFTKLASLIPEDNRLQFSSAARLANQIDTRIRRCIELDSGTYLFVSRIPADMIDPLDQALVKLGIRGGIRLTYEESLKSLIIRLMPGPAHENTSGSFLVNLFLYSRFYAFLDIQSIPIARWGLQGSLFLAREARKGIRD